jgi:hypothetical protein
MANLPPPAAFGLPARFSEWRKNQDVACLSIVDSPSRFLIQVCPTGFGKSVTYMTAAHLVSGRTVILTSTKGLQTQFMSDFGSSNVVDIRGRSTIRVASIRWPLVTTDHASSASSVPCGRRVGASKLTS